MRENYSQHTPYCYVGSNPVGFVDPDGRDWKDKVVYVIGATVAGDITVTITGGTMAVAGVGAIPEVVVTVTGGATVATGTAVAAEGVVMMTNAANNKPKGYNYGKKGNASTKNKSKTREFMETKRTGTDTPETIS